MDFDTTEAAAAEWSQSHKHFQLVFADKSESRLYFTCSLQIPSFFIGIPVSKDDSWVSVCDCNPGIPNSWIGGFPIPGFEC